MPFKNLVLIGMPNSGKTTLGKSIASDLKMRFIDIDAYIEERERKTISEIFKDGEEHFRNIESFYISNLKNLTHTVMSTGGGAILRQENVINLKKNGIIIFIDRPLNKIIKNMDNDGRPLLKDGIDKIYDLYNGRIHLYKKYCDFEIKNDDTIYKAKSDIIEAYNNIRSFYV